MGIRYLPPYTQGFSQGSVRYVRWRELDLPPPRCQAQSLVKAPFLDPVEEAFSILKTQMVRVLATQQAAIQNTKALPYGQKTQARVAILQGCIAQCIPSQALTEPVEPVREMAGKNTVQM